MSNPPLRRSTRASSAQPQGAAARAAPLPVTNGHHATKSSKPVGRTTSQPIKRAPSPTSPPPKKRARSAAPQSDTEDARKPLKKTTSGRKLARKPTANGLPTVAEEPQQLKPYFNPLPTPPEHRRPPNQLFVWGAGNFGQFGMGSDFLGEYAFPKKSPWVDRMISEGAFGSEGAGLETVAAGGLHTLFIDEKGTVCYSSILFIQNTNSL